MTHQLQHVPDALTFLTEHFGLRYWLPDPDGETLGIQARDISAAELERVLRRYAYAIKGRMCHDQEKRLSVFVGGPMNGKRHFKFCQGTTITVHLGHADWAAYRIGDDNHRAWFIGTATSKKKARILASSGVRRP